MRFSAKNKSVIYLEFAKLLRAGFPMENALKTLVKQRLPEASMTLVTSIMQGLDQGKSIGDSVKDITEIEVSDIEHNLISAGERGGRLAEVFRHLSRYYRRIDLSQKKVLAQLVYPVALLHVAIFMTVLPKIVFENHWDAWKQAIYLLFGCYVLCAVGYYLFRRYYPLAAKNERFDQVLSYIPMVGELRKTLAMERFCEVYHIYLLTASLPSEAMSAAGDASQSGQIYQASEFIGGQLAAGLELGPQLRLHEIFPIEFSNGVTTAEESGTVDEEFGRWVKHYGLETEEAFANLQTWLPRAIYLIALFLVAWQVLQFWTSYMTQFGDPLDI